MMNNETVHVGGWVDAIYPVNELQAVSMALSEEEPGEEDWHPAFHEAGKAMIRVPSMPSGHYFVWTSVAGRSFKGRIVYVAG